MCYTRKERDLEREARRTTEKRLMEEDARAGKRNMTGGGRKKRTSH